MLFLKMLQYSQESTWGLFLIKLQAFRIATLLKRLQHRSFPVKIAKFSKAPTLKSNGCFCLVSVPHDSLKMLSKSSIAIYLFRANAETYLKPYKASMMDLFYNYLTAFSPKVILQKSSIINISSRLK